MEHIDLFIMSGQSNMQGQSEAPAECNVPLEVGFEYKFLSDSLEPIQHPTGEDIFVNGEPQLLGAHQRFGSLVPAFALSYHRQSGRKVCVVHCAKGATTVAQWLPETTRFETLTKKVDGAVACLKKAGYLPVRKNIIWLQGESDGLDRTEGSVYIERLRLFWKELKSQLGLEHFMVIRIAEFAGCCGEIIEAQEQLCKNDPDFIMLTRLSGTFTPENGLMQDPDSKAPDHYTNAGYDLLGATAGQNAAKFLNGIPFIP